MKIESLIIENFRSIKKLTLSNLSNTVLITGGNGVGKSSIIHAIRLLKSSYGAYAYNEKENWFSEFNIIRQSDNLKEQYRSILNDPAKQLKIEAEFTLAQEEINFIKSDAMEIILHKKRKESGVYGSYTPLGFIGNIPNENTPFENSILADAEAELAKILALVNNKTQLIGLTITDGVLTNTHDNELMGFLFSNYTPQRIGIIDYHGPNRVFENQANQHLNVNFNDNNWNENQKNSALYNHNNKYNNIKTELGALYIKALIAKESDVDTANEMLKNINKTFTDLFETFFDNKKFLGIKPSINGSISFPVQTASGSTHDINDLSSGEKELLFGYIRLAQTSPKNSILLIDEPELHLNPKMARKLPEFYHNKISEYGNNQIWLVTHSDSIISEVVGKSEFSIYRIQSDDNESNQAIEIIQKSELEKALIDLVGNISDYKPGKKVLILESDKDFDKNFLEELFPEYTSKLNIISAGRKITGKETWEVLQTCVKEGVIQNTIYQISDRDNDFRLEKTRSKSLQKNVLEWDVYHIENYLLQEEQILKVVQSLGVREEKINTEKKIKNILKEYAKQDIKYHVKDMLTKKVHNTFIGLISFGSANEVVSLGLFEGITRSIDKLNAESKQLLSINELQNEEEKLYEEFNEDLEIDNWKKSARGREILRKFVKNYLNGQILYDGFIALLINKLKTDEIKPEGIKIRLEKVLNP